MNDLISLQDTIDAINGIAFGEEPAEESKEQRAKALVELLEQVARYVPPHKPCYWIGGADDDNANYCRKCALAEIRMLRQRGQRGLYLAGGPKYYDEHDSPPYCETCTEHLSGSLTDYAVESELAHYAANQAELLSPYDAQCIAEFLKEAASLEDYSTEFSSVCAWLSILFERGAIGMPPTQNRCRCTLVAARDRLRRCRRAPRRARVACLAPRSLCSKE